MPDSDAHGAESAPLFSLLIFLILVCATPLAWSHDAPSESCGFANTLYSDLTFPEVELISRNHDIGLYRGGKITLNPRVEIDSDVHLGIDRLGRLMQILYLRDKKGSIDRVIGYVLSGERDMQDLFVLPPGNLLSIDSKGQIFKFDWPEWYRAKLDDARKRRWIMGGAASCVSAVASGATAYALGVSPFSTPVIVEFLGLQLVVGGLQAYLWSLNFESDNINTSGVLLFDRLEGYRRAELRRGPIGQISDYLLSTDKGRLSLRGLIETGNGWIDSEQDFQRHCEHDLLARGIPPSNYE